MGKDRMIDMPNGLLGIANNITPLVEQLKIRKMKKLRELADEKGFFVLEGELSKNTKDYDYLYMCLLQKWLRDEHNIDFSIHFHDPNPHTFRYYLNGDYGKFETYEEALQEALILALNEIE